MQLNEQVRVSGDVVPVTSRGASREQAILDAAVSLVSEIGYDKLTTDAIAKRAKASKATMYRRWPGKAEILAEALRRHADVGVACIADTGSVRGDLLIAMDAINITITGDPGPSLLGILEAVREDAVLRDLIREQIQGQSRETGATIAGRAIARGEVLVTDRADLVLEQMVAHLLAANLLNGGRPARQAQEDFVDHVALPLLLGDAVRSQ